MSDTPRTDYAEKTVWRDSKGNRRETKTDTVPAEFARELERELNALKSFALKLDDWNDQLQDQVAELQKDKARLDWLEEHWERFDSDWNCFVHIGGRYVDKYSNIREAIDHAMKGGE